MVMVNGGRFKRGLKWTAIYFFGGAAYGTIEVIVRRHTHISMLLLGGLCLVILVNLARRRFPRLIKCALGALIITLLEFITGAIVNLWLGLGVWDYSDRFMNLQGQICPRFTLYWFLLSLGVFLTYDLSAYLLSLAKHRGAEEKYEESLLSLEVPTNPVRLDEMPDPNA